MARVTTTTFGEAFQSVKTGSGADARADAKALAAEVAKRIGEDYTPAKIRDWLDSQVYSASQKAKKAKDESEKIEAEKRRALFVELAEVKIQNLPASTAGNGKRRRAKSVEEMAELFG